MHTAPDGVEVVAGGETARHLDSPPLLVLDAVTGFLDAHGIGSGPLAWQRIGDGHSNITYLIQRGGDCVVLRRGPRPPLPKSTHDMVREARIQKILGEHGVPVPEIVAVCEDESLLGVPFYLMSRLDGIVITDTIPPHLSSAEQRRATSEAVVDTLVALHGIDVTGGHPHPLAAWGASPRQDLRAVAGNGCPPTAGAGRAIRRSDGEHSPLTPDASRYGALHRPRRGQAVEAAPASSPAIAGTDFRPVRSASCTGPEQGRCSLSFSPAAVAGENNATNHRNSEETTGNRPGRPGLPTRDRVSDQAGTHSGREVT
ncbi:phosphotransferase family protein [Streptomyces misionensis]|uniref:Phosphotransferase family protein n=1 Tax=Streptomyces misionensis TaxID=67331 RepID=A0A5C6K6Q2_9ACTN|nr:phosphotransferase family protein [Streptomyces misionensis]TWV58041.1 phosphotransferase family protein [Streptomyces misionensis]